MNTAKGKSMTTQITEEQFQAYEDVRKSGLANMWDTKYVSKLSGDVLSREDALEVIKQYNTLVELYPNVRSK
tara:strand:+ start:9415 stop:9630 length:216 start_codon:yes stop_codon:yes gene_type:complete